MSHSFGVMWHRAQSVTLSSSTESNPPMQVRKWVSLGFASGFSVDSKRGPKTLSYKICTPFIVQCEHLEASTALEYKFNKNNTN